MDEGKTRLPFDYIYLKPLHDKASKEPKQFCVPAAFEGLSVIAGCWLGYGSYQDRTPTQEDMVSVPFWIVETLGLGWWKYRSEGVPGRTFGETLGIEGRGQGKHPTRERWNNWIRNQGIAKDVYLKRQSITYEAAVADVAERQGVSETTVRRAWKDHGPAIEVAANSFTTSGSGDTD